MDMEQEIKAAGADRAPRITPADIEANIASEWYFTAADGAGAATNTGVVAGYQFPGSLDLLTFCVLVMRNGFTVTGESACASPENFSAEIGRKVARANAVAKVCPLLGFQLKTDLHGQACSAQVAQSAQQALPLDDTPAMPPYQQRVVQELAELSERVDKLDAFVSSPTWQTLPDAEQYRLGDQLQAMREYRQCLRERIAAFTGAQR